MPPPDDPPRQPAASRLKLALRICTSVPALTLAILAAFDIFLRQGNFLDPMGFHTTDVWNAPPRIELCRRTDPDVALIGSSLMLVLNQDAQGRKFYSGRYPPYLQSLLRKVTGEPITCVNLCTGLQMPSEAYLISEAMASQADYPRVIIFGVALRDFIHDQYAREWRCDSFASVAPYVPMRWSVLTSMTSPTAIKELVLCHFWYLYRERTDFQGVMSALVKDWLEYLPLDMSFRRLGADHQWRPQRKGFLWETWVPRQQEKFTESLYLHHPEFLKLYFGSMQADVYRQGSLNTMRMQTHYLQRLIAMCEEKGIQLVIVNMPLSPEFQTLVPSGLYDAFSKFLAEQASERGVVLVDLYTDKSFNNETFKDGVHLNYKGALMLADKIVDTLKNNYPVVIESMSLHARSRQRRPDCRALEAPYE